MLLLSICVTVDYATNSTIVHNESILDMPKNTIVVNESSRFNEEVIKPKPTDKVHMEIARKVKQKPLPTITITAKPSVRSGYAYRWYTTTWIDYCPHCHIYGVLYNAHKPQARFEQELTCKRCGADYCGVVGKEKYSWSRVYLRRA